MTQRRVACLLANGFEESELSEPVAALEKLGFAVDIIGSAAGAKLQGKAGKKQAQVTRPIEEASVNDYLGMLIPGGKSPGVLADDRRFVDFVREFNSSKKPIAAICHGPQLLAAAGLVRGRKLTAYGKLHDGLRQAGAEIVDAPMVADGNWITSRTPADLPQFCEAIGMQFATNANQSWMARGDVHIT